MEARWRFWIIGIEDKVSGEDSSGRAWWQRCGTTGMDTAAEVMQDGNILGIHQHGKTTNLMAYRCSGIMGMADKVSGEYSIGQARWRRCGTTEMYTMVEEM